jgi:hypothetical protein
VSLLAFFVFVGLPILLTFRSPKWRKTGLIVGFVMFLLFVLLFGILIFGAGGWVG